MLRLLLPGIALLPTSPLVAQDDAPPAAAVDFAKVDRTIRVVRSPSSSWTLIVRA